MRWGRIGPGGPAGLQNRDGGAFGDSGGFDSHTLPPPRSRPASGLPLLLFLLVLAGPLAAQDTVLARPAERDTILYPRPPVTPLGAFFRSLLVPGWSQALLGRRLTAGLFMAWEGVTLGMTVKAARELGELERTGASEDRLEDKRQQREDWLVLLAFNHLFAGLEGFVGSHLWDFPEDVRIRGAPDGFGVRVSVPFRLR